MKILVCGGRDFSDLGLLYRALDFVIGPRRAETVTIVHGAASGADAIADQYAAERGHAVRRYPAKWAEHGRAAGPIRNREMLSAELDGLDMVVATKGGSGTADMVKRARAAHVYVRQI